MEGYSLTDLDRMLDSIDAEFNRLADQARGLASDINANASWLESVRMSIKMRMTDEERTHDESRLQDEAMKS